MLYFEKHDKLGEQGGTQFGADFFWVDKQEEIVYLKF